MYEEFDTVWITEPKKHIGNLLYSDRITLSELYRRGWWVTEIFGSYATVVSKSGYHERRNSYDHGRPYFCCKQCQIDTESLTPQIIKQITAINNAHWKQYKRILLKPYRRSHDRRYSKKA